MIKHIILFSCLHKGLQDKLKHIFVNGQNTMDQRGIYLRIYV